MDAQLLSQFEHALQRSARDVLGPGDGRDSDQELRLSGSTDALDGGGERTRLTLAAIMLLWVCRVDGDDGGGEAGPAEFFGPLRKTKAIGEKDHLAHVFVDGVDDLGQIGARQRLTAHDVDGRYPEFLCLSDGSLDL